MDQTKLPAESQLHFLDYWQVIKARKVIIFVVFLLVILMDALISFFLPKVYEASVVLRVEEERPDVTVFENRPMPAYNPYFLNTQLEIIRSEKILRQVVSQLGLQKDFSELGDNLAIELATRQLRRNVSAKVYQNTSLLEISVQSENPKLAADVANATAEVFERDRLQFKRDQTIQGLAKVREEMESQRARMQEAQLKMEQLRRELDVPLAGNIKLTDQTLQQLEQLLTSARVEAAATEARLKELQKLDPIQLRNAIATVITDQAVQSLLQALNQAELKLEILKEDYGPEHPNVKAAIAEKSKLQEQMDGRLEGVMRGFEVDYRVAVAKVRELQEQYDEAKNASLVLESEKYLPFRNAQREESLETSLYEALRQRLQQASVDIEVPRSPVEVLDHAEVPRTHIRPNIPVNMILGTIVGIVLGVGLSFFIEFLDTSIKKVDDVERYLGLPVLGVVPQEASLLSQGVASASDVEAYRMLRANIEFNKESSQANSLCIVSSGMGEGKTFTVANLACIYAQHGGRTLIVDTDLRRPGVHHYFDIPNEVGLSDYLVVNKQIQDVVQSTKIPNVSIISAGSRNNVQPGLSKLTSDRMVELIQQLQTKFDFIFYDTAPILGVSDAAVLARVIGSGILVIQHRRFPRNTPQRALQIMENAGCKMLGVVVNNATEELGEIGYYYHYNLEHDGSRLGRPVGLQGAGRSKSEDIDLAGKY